MKSRIQTVAEGSLYITLFTLLSKGLGFFREVITANLFGTSWKMDALIISLAPARIITSILAAGFVAIFIPEYMKIRNSSKEREFVSLCLGFSLCKRFPLYFSRTYAFLVFRVLCQTFRTWIF